MSRSTTYLTLILAAVLLAACGDRAEPLTPVDPLFEGAVPLGPEADSRGLVRMEIPEDNPGVPAYVRIESDPSRFIVDGWAVVAFYRDPDCVRPDFNLLEFFDPPAAFGCTLTTEGFALYEPGVFPGAPKIVQLHESGAVSFWFIPAETFLAATEDGVLTIGELEAMAGRLAGSATRFTEALHPPPDVLGGGHPNSMMMQRAHGTLEDGRSFQYHVTVRDDVVRSIGLNLR